MSLLTIERSSSSDSLNQLSGTDETDTDELDAELEDVFVRSRTSSFEGFFASKGAAVAIPDGDFARKATLKGGELQFHLQGMVNMLRDEDAMRLIVKLETEAEYTRYLSIVTCYGTTDEEESMLLGFDWVNEEVTVGLVIPLWSHVSIGLDGDGGFKVETKLRDYIFKPVSVQTMWTALQWIHRCITTAQQANQHPKGLSHSWLGYYQNRISSPREFINYWESMDDITNKRDGCVTYFDKVKTDEELLKRLIRHKLKEILKRFDLDEVTCREIRNVLEAEMKMSLNHLKGFVDEQMFIVVGQMDSSSKITDNIFLGSEWNASNLQELKENGVGYILNITKEIDNFFPGTFEYMNIRLYDVEESDLLQHWSETYRFLHEAKEKGYAALVHCRRGISRSASTVVAFLMKEHNMSLHDAMKLVKSKRCIVEPNAGFWKQLIVYEGMLKSSRNRHNKLFRRRVNSDSTSSRRSSRKYQRQKKEICSETDHIDGTSTHAHTLPRMTSREGAPAAAPLETATEDVSSIPQITKTYITSEMPDADSEDEASDSESETSSTTSKIRRTLSAPLMKSLEDFGGHIPSERKARARTFTEHTRKNDSESNGDLKSPTWSTEMIENTLDGTASNGTSFQVTEQSPDVETQIVLENAEEKLDELSLELSPGSTNLSENANIDIAREDNGQGPIADEVELIATDSEGCVTFGGDGAELARDDPRDNDENSRDGPMDSMDTSSTECDQPRSRSIGENLEEKLVLKQGKSESSENLKEVEGRGRVRRRVRKAKSDLQLSDSGFVKRHTQVIEEQMLYSSLMNSEKTLASSAGNDAHVTEGEASVTEGEAPVDLSENDAMLLSPEIRGDCENSNVIAAENKKYSNNNEENSEKNKENSENNEQNSEKNKETSERNEVNSEKNGNNSEHNEQNSENNERNFKEIEDNSEKNEQNFVENVENSGNNEEEESSKNDEKEENSENNLEMKHSENNVEMKNSEIDAESERNLEIQNIVQEVNAEAKRDIQGQVASWLPLISQKDSGTSDPQGNDDVCIDEMAWIDLTHHHGDVVKRKSAVFENASEERNQAKSATEFSSWKDEETENKLGRSLTRPRGEMETDQHFVPEVDKRSLEIPRDDGNVAVTLSTSDGECLIEGLDYEVLRLDLGELVNDEELSETSRSSNSIVVDDYGSWESSGVRERTKILEKIIAKNGGSFRSPRTMKVEKETPSTVDEKSKVQVNRLLSSSSDTVEIRNDLLMVEDTMKARARSSSCPLNNSLSLNDDELFGEEMVKILVDKFEGKNDDPGSKCHDI